jgi:tetratricopeptide (TPR) repeat protein
MSALAAALWHVRQGEEACAMYAEAHARAVRGLGDAHPLTIDLARDHAVVLGFLGRDDEAEPIYRAALAAARPALGEFHPGTLRLTEYLGNVLWRLDRRNEAREVWRDLISVQKRLASSPNADATSLADSAWFMMNCPAEDLRDFTAALPLARRAVEISDGRQIEFLDTLAMACHRNGDLEQAIETQRLIFDLPDSVYRYGEEQRMIDMLAEQGEPGSIERFLSAHLEHRRGLVAADDPVLAESYRLLALDALRNGRVDLALERFDRALAQLRRKLPDDDWLVSRVLGESGQALVRVGRIEEGRRRILDADIGLRADPRASESALEQSRARVEALH